MEARMRRLIKSGKSNKTLALAGGDLGGVNTRVIRLAAEAGDPVAGKVWAEAVESLVTLSANLTSLLNPDRLVIGGGVLAGNLGLLKIIAKGVKQRAVTLTGKHVKVVKSKLGDNAVAMGAAALAELHK